MLRTLSTAGVATGLALLMVSQPVAATPVPPVGCRVGPTGQVCDVTADRAGTDGAGTPDRPSSGTATSSTKRTCLVRGEPIDCDPPEPGLWWSNERGCWVGLADPQPPKDDPVWQGNTDGSIFQCRRAGGGLGSGTWLFWTDTPPPTAQRANPAELAERAVERMQLKAPVLAMTPVDPDAPLLVGMDAWMWLADDGPNSVGPMTRTATAGATTVTATARVTTVVWEMGDGRRVTCAGAGTPWSPDKGTGPSPTCGHRYLTPSSDQPGGTFPVRATAHWEVQWNGAGQSGVITFALSGERDLTVTELQVLQTS